MLRRVLAATIIALLSACDVSDQGNVAANRLDHAPAPSPTSEENPASDNDDQPLLQGGELSLQQIDEYVKASAQASSMNVQCIQNVVRQSDPATRRGDVIDTAFQRCAALAQQAAEMSRKINPDAPKYSDERERQTIRGVIRDEAGPHTLSDAN